MNKIYILIALSITLSAKFCLANATLLVPRQKIDSVKQLIDNHNLEDKEFIHLLHEYARLNFYNRNFLIGFESIIAAKDLAEKIKYPEGDIMYHTSLAAFLGRHHIYEYHLDEAASLKRQLGVEENFDQLHFPEGYPSERDSSFIVPLNPVRNHFRQLGEMEIEAAIIDASIWAHFNEGNYGQCYIDNLRFIELYKTLGEHYPVFVHYTYISYIGDYADIVDMDWLKAEFASFFATVNDIETMSRLYLHIGNFFRNSGQPQKAIEYYLNGSDYYESLNDQEMLARIYRSLGELYNRLEMYPQYAEIIEKRISILSDLNRTSEMYEEYEKAVWAMFEAHRFDDARNYIDALITGTTQQNQELLTGNKNNLEGRISMEEGDFKRAIPFLLNSLEIYQKADQGSLIPWINMHLATCYFKLGELDVALKYALVSYNDPIYLSDSDKYEKAINYLLSVLYDAKGNQIQAYQHLKKYNDLISEKSNVSDEVFETLISSTIQKSQRDIERLEQEKLREESQNKIQRLWILFVSGALIFAIILALVLYRNIQNKQKANNQLKEQKEEIETTLEKLESTQSQLIQSEKLASLGELTAGIAHEIQNPLNFVNNFAEVNKELIEELKDAVASNDQEEIQAILKDLSENEDKVKHHGQRAEGIVKGMLQHSRTSQGEKEPTDLNALADEYLRLAYHGMRAKDKSFNAEFKTEFDESLPKIEVVPQDIGRVLLNLINNAFYAVSQKAARHSDPVEESGAAASHESYKPEVIVTSKATPLLGGAGGGFKGVQITVKDNGPGIPSDIKDKIFQPFFTTKPTGSGTGLGLSLSYDIVKAHGGELKVESQDGTGSEFIIEIPIKNI